MTLCPFFQALSSYYNNNGYVPTAMPYGYPYGFPMSSSGSASVPSNNQTYVLDLPPANTMSSGKKIMYVVAKKLF